MTQFNLHNRACTSVNVHLYKRRLSQPQVFFIKVFVQITLNTPTYKSLNLHINTLGLSREEYKSIEPDYDDYPTILTLL